MSKIAFIYPGQGAQKAGMGRDFYENSPLAAKLYDQASQALGLDMKALCFEENEKLDLTEYTQAALVTTCLAMTAVLKEQGITGRKPGLTQFLGIEEEEYQIDPQISVTETREGDLYLLCSDGLTDMCSEEEIVEILSRDEAVAACVEELTDRALKHGGRDNITVILCRVE